MDDIHIVCYQSDCDVSDVFLFETEEEAKSFLRMNVEQEIDYLENCEDVEIKEVDFAKHGEFALIKHDGCVTTWAYMRKQFLHCYKLEPADKWPLQWLTEDEMICREIDGIQCTRN